MKAIALFCFSVAAAFFLSACVPVLTSVIAYDAAVSSQEHAAYTDYLLKMQAKNKTLQQTSEQPEPIITKAKWVSDVYRPKLEYAEYYVKHTGTNSSATASLSFEVWKETEYPKILAERARKRTQFDHKK